LDRWECPINLDSERLTAIGEPDERSTTIDEEGEGWLIFAAVVLGVAGIMRVFDAIWAFRYQGCWIRIFAAAVMAISAIWWMPFYPVWSLTNILVGVLVIYGLAAYGGREVTS
jgi:hypothetical protein